MALSDRSPNSPSAFIFHHTGGRGNPAGVQATLNQRGLGVQYIMDRDGNITQFSGPGASHMQPGSGAGAGLSNKNTVGMEVIARNNADVTPQQVAAAQAFIAKNYPNLPVYGHGEVNPGHKEADEGLAIVNAIRGGQPPRPPMPIPEPAAPQFPPSAMAQAPQPTQMPAGGPLDLMALMGKGPGQPQSLPPLFAPQSQAPQGITPQNAGSASAPQSFFASLPAGPQQMAGNDLANWWARMNPTG